MFKLIGSIGRSNGLAGVRTAYRTFCEEAPRMEKTINSVQLLGRVGTDPEQKGSEEHPCVTFTLATHSNYKKTTGEYVQRVDWHKISVFHPTLRNTVQQYMTKGRRVIVNGKIAYGQFEDGMGVSRTVTTVIADDIIFFQ